MVKRGQNFLLTPGPTNIPERVLAAMNRNAVDLGGSEFVNFARTCLDDLRPVFKTSSEVFGYIANGHGTWEAALVNLLAPGERVLVPSTGHFAENWAAMAESLGLLPEILPGDWRHAVDPADVEARLSADRERRIKALLLVHTDTATGITSDIAQIRAAMDRADHPVLLLVDAVASLGTTDLQTDAWGIDVAVSASQKALMAPPGLGFVAVSERALRASEQAGTARSYWDWTRRRDPQWYRWFCGTAPEHLLFALRVALDMLLEEGLDNAFARHQRLAQAVRAAVSAWGEAGALELNAKRLTQAANAVTTVRVSDHASAGIDANQIKADCFNTFNVSLGGGLSQLDGKAFRIGHMGYINEPTILGALASIEASLQRCGVPYNSGIGAAIDLFARTAASD